MEAVGSPKKWGSGVCARLPGCSGDWGAPPPFVSARHLARPSRLICKNLVASPCPRSPSTPSGDHGALRNPKSPSPPGGHGSGDHSVDLVQIRYPPRFLPLATGTSSSEWFLRGDPEAYLGDDAKATRGSSGSKIANIKELLGFTGLAGAALAWFIETNSREAKKNPSFTITAKKEVDAVINIDESNGTCPHLCPESEIPSTLDEAVSYGATEEILATTSGKEEVDAVINIDESNGTCPHLCPESEIPSTLDEAVSYGTTNEILATTSGKVACSGSGSHRRHAAPRTGQATNGAGPRSKVPAGSARGTEHESHGGGDGPYPPPFLQCSLCGKQSAIFYQKCCGMAVCNKCLCDCEGRVTLKIPKVKLSGHDLFLWSEDEYHKLPGLPMMLIEASRDHDVLRYTFAPVGQAVDSDCLWLQVVTHSFEASARKPCRLKCVLKDVICRQHFYG